MTRPVRVTADIPSGWSAEVRPILWGAAGWWARGWFTDGTCAPELIVYGFAGWTQEEAEAQIRYWIEDTDALDRAEWWPEVTR